MARRTIELNGLTDQVLMINDDLKDINKRIGNHKYDIVTCNPPFFKVNEVSHLNKNDYLTLARHEVTATLEDVVKEASILLKHGGYFAMVHRPDRLVDIIETLRTYKLEPKRLRFVYPKPGKDANTILIEACKSNPGGLKILEPLYVYQEDGTYSEEITEIFQLKKE
jgi:tRNA1(Val) A37 N6-methylase TrmN6